MKKIKSECQRIKAIMDVIEVGVTVEYIDSFGEIKKGKVLNIKPCPHKSTRAYYCDECKGCITIEGTHLNCMLNTDIRTGKCKCRIIKCVDVDFFKENDFMI